MDIENDEETTTEAPLSLRDTLTKAMETPVETAPVEVIEPAEGETAEQAAQRARDEAGRFAKQPKAVKPKATEKPVVAPKPAAAVKPAPGVKPAAAAPAKPGVQPVVPAAQAPAVPEMKPPQSWRGPAKEKWAAMPEEARIEVLRREKEITGQLGAAAEDRKYAGTMKQAFAPFEAQIRAEGSTPEAAIGKLMNTALALRTAPPAHKAALVADMITTYGVPLEHLVAELSKQPPAPGQQPQQQPQHVDPAAIAAQVEKQLMERLGTQRDTAMVARAEAELSTFLDKQPMHGLDGTDYSEEIRQDMADIIERAAARNVTLTLDQAYGRAAREHPEVSKVFEKQERAVAASKANASTTKARAATVSVRNQPTTTPVVKGGGGSLRQTLEEALEANSGR